MSQNVTHASYSTLPSFIRNLFAFSGLHIAVFMWFIRESLAYNIGLVAYSAGG